MSSEISFEPNYILIIDAVPENELQTARTLECELDDIQSRFTIKRVRCNDPELFVECLKSIKCECKESGIRPIIHLEGHGSPSEFYFPNATAINWSVAFEEFREINIACGNHLLVTSAACYSACSYSFDLSPFDRPAPVFGIIAPPNEIKAGQAKDSYLAFYSALIQTGSFRSALDAVSKSQNGMPFAIMFSAFMFEQSMALYLRTQCMGSGLRRRQEKLVSYAKSERNISPNRSRKVIKNELRKPQALEIDQYHKIFMHIDSHPENRDRFPFSAVEFERLIKTKDKKAVQPDIYAIEALRRIGELT